MMGATREELLNLADFWESRGDPAEAERLRCSAAEQDATLTWTGERVRNAGLLYQNYDDRGIVRDEDGNEIGEVLRLANGLYQPRVPGLRDFDQATATDAVARVVYMHRRYRS